MAAALPHKQPGLLMLTQCSQCDQHCLTETGTQGELSAVLTQVVAKNNNKKIKKNCMRCGTLAKHSPANREKYAARLSILINIYQFMFTIPFSVYMNTLPESFQMECIELQSDIQPPQNRPHLSTSLL